MRESRIQTQIVKYLKQHDIYYIKTIKTNRRGAPDLVICVNGAFVACEIKTQTGQLTALQKYELDNILKSKGRAFVARSCEEFIYKIEQIKACT